MGGVKEFLMAQQEELDRLTEFAAERRGIQYSDCGRRPLAHEVDYFAEYGKCPDHYEQQFKD